jgi:TonB family protein
MFLLALGISTTLVRGDDREDAEKLLRTNLRGNLFALRHFSAGDRLKFDAEGNMLKSGDVCPWTICAQIEISDVNLRNDKLEVKGRRIILQYKEGSKNPSGLRGSSVSIEIEIPRDTVKSDALLEILNRVFTSSYEQLAEVVPAYWTKFLLSSGSEKKADDGSLTSNGQPVQKIEAGKVSAPKRLYTPSPDYSVEARQAGYQGEVVLSLVVNTQGNTENISIVKPVGMGLDEKAVEKVQTWKFKPGMRDGSPVPVRVMLEIMFRLFGKPLP